MNLFAQKYRRLSVWIGTVVVALSGAGVAVGESNDSKDAFGCAPNRAAVAHYAGGVVANNPPGQAKKAPVPCSAPTGWGSDEMGMAVTSAGTVIITPAFPDQDGPIGLIRSTNNGKSWRFINPVQTPPRVDVFDGNLGVDNRTGRIFWMTPGYFYPFLAETAGLWFSDDDGKNWSAGAGSEMVPPSGRADHLNIFVGPPTPASRGKMKGYPNVVYFCGGHKPLRCQASHDGGLSWDPSVFIPFPPELAPIQGPANDCSSFGLTGAVGKDGTAYVGYTPCNRPYVAISRDEGQTWQSVKVADVETIGWGMAGVAMDEAGTLYSSWVAASDRLPYLSISRNGGQTWSNPVMIGAPGINEAALPKVVAGKAGHIAVAYYGSKNSPGAPFPAPCSGTATSCPAWQNVTWNTYITETFDARKALPIFWSAPINDPAAPSSYGCSASSTGVIRLDESVPFQFGPGFTTGCWNALDYFAMQMSQDGTPWIGFPQMCLAGGAGNPNCPKDTGSGGGDPDADGGASGGSTTGINTFGTGTYFAILGRLVHSNGSDDGGSDDDDKGHDRH